MGLLTLNLLGQIRIHLNHQPLTGLNHKTIALLAYLVVDSDQAHHREALANLLWPNASMLGASNNFRQTLWRLRQALRETESGSFADTSHEPFLIVTRDTVQFNPASAYHLDVDTFRAPSGADIWVGGALQDQIPHLKRMVVNYGGNFLQNLNVHDSPMFDEWVTVRREQINLRAILLLHHLVSLLEANGQYAEGQEYARRQLEVDPYNEEACRQLMRAQALGGQRSAALTFYEQWSARLMDNLGVTPEVETQAIFVAIRDEVLSKYALLGSSADQFMTPSGGANIEIPFVTRQVELATLETRLKQARAGQGRVVSIVGEAGSGKTFLLNEFTRRSLAEYPDLVPVSASCSGFIETKAPLLPFREMFHQLCGDFSALQNGSELNRVSALRLWSTLPNALHAILQYSPDLINIFAVSPDLIQQRIQQLPKEGGWMKKLDAVIARQGSQSTLPAMQQAAVFDQFTRMLRVLSQSHPLLLIIEDITWIDEISLALIFHLSMRLAGSRILLAVTVRSDDSGGENGVILRKALSELQREYGERNIDLDKIDGQAFIAGCLDALPNDFSPEFAERLYTFTGGHALFTVEMLYNLRENGHLTQNARGVWRDAPGASWTHLPARIEAVLARRLDGLPANLRALLLVASIFGEVFLAEAIALILALPLDGVTASLHERLAQDYNLVRPERTQRISDQTITFFRFRHNLFQHYLYEQLDRVERANLHEQAALTLEKLVGLQGDAGEAPASETSLEWAPQIAFHFEQANRPLDAARILYILGKSAYRRLAVEQATSIYTQALALLNGLPASAEGNALEINLYLELGSALAMLKGWGTLEANAAFDHALNLCKSEDSAGLLCAALKRLAISHFGRGDDRRSLALAQELLTLSERMQNDAWTAQAYTLLGQINVARGDLARGIEQLHRSIRLAETQSSAPLASEQQDVHSASNARMMLACGLIATGSLLEAEHLARAGVQAARISKAAHVLEFAQVQHCVCLFLLNYPVAAIRPYYESLARQVNEKGMTAYLPWIHFLQGKLLAGEGCFEEGIDLMQQAITQIQRTGVANERPFLRVMLAEACLQAGRAEEGQAVVSRGLAQVENLNARLFESVYYRIQGDLWLLDEADEVQAEASLHKAVAIARRQKAKTWELQGAASLAHLRHRQRRPAEARALLEGQLACFQDESGSPIVEQAREVFSRLSSNG